jgi:hypothetical protein
MSPRISFWSWIAGGALLGLGIFLVRFDPVVLDPLRVSWIGPADDITTYQLGWLFFRLEPWQWPPAHVSALGAPVGTTIGLTDSIPLVALPLKAILGPNSPDLQYLGPWWLSTYVLQGAFGAALAWRLTARPTVRVFLAVVLAISPIFLHRIEHAALSAHWLLLWGAWIYLFASRRWPVAIGPVAVTGLVHPYLAMMVFGVSLAAVVRDAGARRRTLVFRAATLVAVLVTTFVFSGVLSLGASIDSYGAGGYGWYSANLLGPINGDGRVALGPAIPRGGAQYEGFNYLGLGMVLVLAIVLIRPASRRDLWQMIRSHRVLFVVLLATTLLAISHRPMFGPWKIATIGLPWFMDDALAAFRASGRFVWPAWYFAVLALAVVGSRSSRLFGHPAIWIALLTLQVVDLRPMWSSDALSLFETPEDDPFREWEPFMAGADTLSTYPPFLDRTTVRGDHLMFSRIAYDHRIPVTTSYSARRPVEPTRRYTAWLRARLLSPDPPRPGERVVIKTDSLGVFRDALRGRYHLYRVGEHWLASGEPIEGVSTAIPAE